MPKLSFVRNLELRAEQTEDSMILEGYALKFEEETELWPGYTEQISRDALVEADLTDVVLCMNHDLNSVVARTTAGSLTLNADDTGLFMRAELPNTRIARDLFDSIKSGLITAMSFCATVAKREYDFSSGNVTRTVITQFGKFFDVSAVVFPAYDTTEIEARSREATAERARMEGGQMPEPIVRSEDETPEDTPVESRADEETETTEEANEDVVASTDDDSEGEPASDEDAESEEDMPNSEERTAAPSATIERSLVNSDAAGGVVVRGHVYNVAQRSEFFEWAESVRRGADTGSASGVVPTIVVNAIETAIREGGSIASMCDVTTLGVTSFPIETGKSKGKTKDEGSSTAEGTFTLSEALMIPKFVQEWIDITAELEKLAIDAFAPYLLDAIIDSVLVALDNAVLVGTRDANGRGILGIANHADTFVKSEAVAAIDFSTASLALKWIRGKQPVIAMNRQTFFGTITALRGTDGHPIYSRDLTKPGQDVYYIDGMLVHFTDELPSFDEAEVGETWAIAGTFKGYKLNFPDGYNVETVRDELTQIKSGKVTYLARVFGAGHVTKLQHFCKLTKAEAPAG